MKKTVLLLIALCLVCTPLILSKEKGRSFEKIKFPPLNKLNLPEPIQADLANGIRLRTILNDKLPLVNMTILVKGGKAYESAGETGLADTTAELMRIGGTKGMKPAELDLKLDSKAIDISIYADTDFYVVNVNCLKENLEEAVSLLSKIIREPAFDSGKLEEVKTKMAGAIARRNDEPAAIMQREFARLIYGPESPFAAVQEYAHLDKITPARVEAAYQGSFAPDNLLWGAVGALQMPELKALVEKYFGDWTGKAALPSYPEVKEQPADFKVAFSEKSEMNQTYLAIGHLGAVENLEDKAKVMVFNNIFSQGMDSRLFNKVRTKMGLTYGVGGGINREPLHKGTTSYWTFTKTQSTLKAVKAIFEEIELVRKEPVTAKELADAKAFLLDSFIFRYDSPEKILQRRLNAEFYNTPLDADKKLQEDVEKVTIEDVKAVAEKYLDPAKMVVYIVGKEADLDGKLEELGAVKKIDLTIPPPALQEKIPQATPETLKQGKEVVKGSAEKAYKGYKTLKSALTAVSTTLVLPQGEFSISQETTQLYPDKSYTAATMPFGKVETIINGEKGITKAMGQVQPLPAEQIKDQRFSDDYNVFRSLDLYSFQYLKSEKVGERECDVVYATREKGWMKLFFDKTTGYILARESQESFMGQTEIARWEFDDYKVVEGIPVAYTSRMLIKGKRVVDGKVTKFVVNPKVQETLFQVSEKK